jgi:hypothetical protein
MLQKLNQYPLKAVQVVAGQDSAENWFTAARGHGCKL